MFDLNSVVGWWFQKISRLCLNTNQIPYTQINYETVLSIYWMEMETK